MLTAYIQAALHEAKYEILPDDGSFYGHIPGLDGVWANASSHEGCRDELEQVLEEWILLRVSMNLAISAIGVAAQPDPEGSWQGTAPKGAADPLGSLACHAPLGAG